MRIVTLCGSVQRQSSNRELLGEIEKALSARHTVQRCTLLAALVHFNPDLEGEHVPPVVERFREQMAQAEALVIATPEYGHSLPGVLKNGIDWLIPSGELHHKPVAITTAVGHPDRGLQGLAALQQTLLAVDMNLVFNRPTVTATRTEDIERLVAAFAQQ